MIPSLPFFSSAGANITNLCACESNSGRWYHKSGWCECFTEGITMWMCGEYILAAPCKPCEIKAKLLLQSIDPHRVSKGVIQSECAGEQLVCSEAIEVEIRIIILNKTSGLKTIVLWVLSSSRFQSPSYVWMVIHLKW